MLFELPKLDYAYNALEPHIDARTMEIHHTKHHAAYTDKLNNAIAGSDLEGQSIEEILSKVSSLPVVIRNNGGGFYNHNLFWKVMSPKGGGEPSGDLADAIEKDFGSFENFIEEFSNAAATRFGSGWAWLIKTDSGLQVTSTPNQDNPLMDVSETKGIPILGLDVWEHAYYLHYQNRRPDYISAFRNVINWDEVSKRFR
ncbi:MAG: superoxide dismutase [Bacteroidales bacterium]|jgi:Fe-Mn family superoxide dismutase|nr:superoxide dismutase [Bacteroidales bacterium]